VDEWWRSDRPKIIDLRVSRQRRLASPARSAGGTFEYRLETRIPLPR
jgi:hypothetical protein